MSLPSSKWGLRQIPNHYFIEKNVKTNIRLWSSDITWNIEILWHYMNIYSEEQATLMIIYTYNVPSSGNEHWERMMNTKLNWAGK